MNLSATLIRGRFVRLEPLQAGLHDELNAALSGHEDDWLLMAGRSSGDAFPGWWAGVTAAMERGERITYAVRRLQDGRVVGTSSFIDMSPAHRRVEIGATFLAAEARGGGVNPDMKLLMLAHAFTAGAVRVELVTDARNLRSQAAIAKLGAAREGVLRRHKITWTGHVRDTVMFSITDQDWPQVRAGLEARLDRLAAPAGP